MINIIRLEKPNRACGSSTYLLGLPFKFPDMCFIYVVQHQFHRTHVRDMFKQNKNVDFYTYDDINKGKFFGRYGIRDSGIVIVLDYSEYKSQYLKSPIDMDNLNMFIDLCGGHCIVEIEVPRSNETEAFIYAPYIPLQFTGTTI